MTSNKSGQVLVYDISYKNYIKKFWPGNSQINLLYMFNDLEHFAAGCQDGGISIMKIQWQFSKQLNRGVFRDANVVHTLKSKVPV